MTDLLNEFFQETDRNLSEARSELDNWERNLTDPQALNGVFRIVHNVKATCHVLGFGRVESLAHAAEDVLYAIREGQVPVVPEAATAIRDTVARIEAILEEIRIERSEPLGNDQDLIDRVRGFLGGFEVADVAAVDPGGYALDGLLPTGDHTITLDEPEPTPAAEGSDASASQSILGSGEPLLAEAGAAVTGDGQARPDDTEVAAGSRTSGEAAPQETLEDSDFFLDDGETAPARSLEDDFLAGSAPPADGAGLLSGTEPLFDFSDQSPPSAAEVAPDMAHAPVSEDLTESEDVAASAGRRESEAPLGEGDTLTGIDLLHPNPEQPRRRMDEEGLAALALSISTHGILHPILVRRHPTLPGQYEIVAGERRWRASQMAGLTRVRIALLDTDDRDALQISLVENLQREDLGAIEEAEGYQRLIESFGHTQEAVADIVGRSRSHVANTLRLLGLPPAVKEMLQQGALTAGHARALLSFAEPEVLAKKVVDKGLSVRETEILAKRGEASPGPRVEAALPRSELRALEKELAGLLGTRVRIALRGESGKMMLAFNSIAALDDIVGRLRQLARSDAA